MTEYTGILNRELVMYVIQVITIYNIMCGGWHVKKIGDRTYELTKDMANAEGFKLREFIDSVINVE